MILIGIRQDGSSDTNWYRAHSLTRRRDGSFTAFMRNMDRTPHHIKARNMVGVIAESDDSRTYVSEGWPEEQR